MKAVQTGETGGTDDMLEEQVSRARGMPPQRRADSDIERGAHRETMESLELSETSVRIYVYTCTCSVYSYQILLYCTVYDFLHNM